MKGLTHVIKTLSRGAKLGYLKHRPEILVYGGIAGFLAAGIMACIETKHAEDILDEGMTLIEEIEARLDLDERAKTRAKARARFMTFIKLVINYSPSAALALASGYGIIRGHNITRKRELDATAALALLASKYDRYRQGVRELYGDEVNDKILYGLTNTRESEIIKDPETGKDKKRNVTKTRSTTDLSSDEVLCLMEDNWSEYVDNFDTNWANVKRCENACQDILNRKTIFGPTVLLLSEVIDKLGYSEQYDLDFNERIANKGWVSFPEDPAVVSFGLDLAKDAHDRGWFNVGRNGLYLHFNCVDNVFAYRRAVVNEQ